MRTTDAVDDGSYTIIITATDAGGVTRYGLVHVELVVANPHRSFTISGDLQGQLAPAVSRPLGLTVTNPDKAQVSVTNLSVSITSITRSAVAVAAGRQCTTADYTVTQYSGPYPLAVPGSSSRTLTQLGVPSTVWPQVAMIDRPVNQDGCKGATLTLAYAGSGTGN